MKKLPKPLQYMILLICLGLITGGLLAVVNSITAPKISAFEEEKTTLALKELVSFDSQEEVTDSYKGSIKEITNIYALKNSEGKIISIVYKLTTKGYGGDVVTLVAINTEDDTFINSTVISASNETPGLGSKIFGHDFKISEKETTSEDFAIISGATYSSNAVVNAIKIASNNYEANKQALKEGAN